MRGDSTVSRLLLCAVVGGLISFGQVSNAGAQQVDIESLLLAKRCLSSLSVGNMLYGGLADGGVLVWDRNDPSHYTRWTTSVGLTANRVTDLAFSGRYLWVATDGGGLTRALPSPNEPDFRQFTTNLGSLKLTSVAGSMRGNNEIVYYGIQNGGVGVINDGFPGLVYTAEEHGLADNRVTDLAFYEDELWIATEQGISQFRSNVFGDRNDGLGNLTVQTLHVAGDTLLVAGTADGAYKWNPRTGQWDRLSGLNGSVISLAGNSSEIWALLAGDVTTDRLWQWQDPTWTPLTLPFALSRTILVDGDLWVAGEYRDAAMSSRTGRAFLARRDGDNWSSYVTDEQLPLNVDGVDFGPDGSLWLGSLTGDAVARYDGSAWFNIYHLATVDNDSMGLFADDNGYHGPNILSLATRPNGEVWFSQFRQGIVRYTPASGSGQVLEDFEHLTSDNSGLSHNRVVQTVVHPAGPILFLNDRTGVDVLIDPNQWPRSDQWVALPADSLRGINVRNAVVERNDVIWFAVDQVGLVRWDVNGTLAGPDDALTWNDFSDDRWDEPIASLSGTNYEFRGTRSIVFDRQGNIWAGGGGVVQFRFNPGSSPLLATAELLNEFREKSDVFFDGLLSNSVVELALDTNGDIWVACDLGLNRIRFRDEDIFIDAYTSLTKYFEFDLGVLYSPQIITGLPVGATLNELVADPVNRRLLVSSGSGAALVTIGPLATGSVDPLSTLFLYPNPFTPSETQLKLGGITADVTFANGLPAGGARVEIYNLEGQLVYKKENVEADGNGFWDGRNRFGNSIAAGIYLVKVTLGEQTAVKSLAVVP